MDREKWERRVKQATGEVSSPRLIRLVGVGAQGQTTSRLFVALRDGLTSRGFDAEYEIRKLPKGVRASRGRVLLADLLECWRLLRNTEALLIHTPLAPSIIVVLAAIARRTPVIAYVWDLHPESNRRLGIMRSPLRLAAFWMLERFIMAVASTVVVPSADYLGSLGVWRRKARIVPLWPCDSVVSDAGPRPTPAAEPVRIAFAGQINGVRGIEGGLALLRAFWGERDLELHLYSGDELPAGVRDVVSGGNGGSMKVVEHGHVAPDDLQRELSSMDFGWVCLDPTFDLPAYPSKSLAYFSAGLPVLFSGPALPGYRRWLEESGLGVSIDRGAVAPGTLDAIRAAFPGSRDHYYALMDQVWFSPPFLRAPGHARRRPQA